MVNFEVVKGNVNLGISFPTSITEIDFAYLANLTKHVSIAPNYSLIALIFKEKPITIISQMKQGKNAQVAAVPYFINHGETDSKFIDDIKIGQAIISAPSDLVMGHHIGIPANPLTPEALVSYTRNNPTLYKELMGVVAQVLFVQFKLVPNNIIHGAFNEADTRYIDKYVKVLKDN